MILAITTRYGKRDNGREVYYILKEYKDICDKLNITLIPVLSLDYIDKICDLCDGVILTGSGNQSKEINEYNDKLDFKLIKEFNKENKYIIGICRGMQMINIYFGGSLSGEIENHNLKDNERHNIYIDKESNLYEIYNRENIKVNSMHNYSIKNIANNFKVSAVSEDGIIEGIEKDNIIGVQYHPEVMLDYTFFEYIKNKIKKAKKIKIKINLYLNGSLLEP